MKALRRGLTTARRTRRRTLGALAVALGWSTACGLADLGPPEPGATLDGEPAGALAGSSTGPALAADGVSVDRQGLTVELGLYTGDKAEAALNATRQARLAALRTESRSDVELTVDAKSRAVLSLALDWSPGVAAASPEATALAFVRQYQPLLDERVAAAEYRVSTEASPCPSTLVRLDRFVAGKQVVGSRLSVHLDGSGRVLFVTNGVAPVRATVVPVKDPTALTKKAVPLAKYLGKVPLKAVMRVPVLAPMPDGSGLYAAELAAWSNGVRTRAAVVIGDIATSDELDASAQGVGRSGSVAPRVEGGADTDVPSQVHFRGIGGQRVAFLEGERNPLEAAFRFLEEHPTLYRTGVARCQYLPRRLVESPVAPGVFSARLAQRHGALPVFGAELVVRLEGRDTVQGVVGRTRGVIAVEPKARITAADAVDAAKRVLAEGAARSPAWKGAVEDASRDGARTELVVLPGFLNRSPQVKGDRLAYRVDLGSFTVVVDAASRQALWSATHRHEASVVRDARGASELSYLSFETVEVDGIPRPGAPTPNADVASTRIGGGVSSSLARTQALFARNGWLGLNGRGSDLVANTNVALMGGACPNAFFDSLFTGSAFFCLGMASADVVGHEFTHGVISRSSGLLYADQSGAINEAYADLFGNLMDTSPGWLIGEQTTSGALRDMQNPGAFGDPAHFAAYAPRTAACGPWPWDCDSGFVHTNSGIVNRAHATLADGVPGAFPGIGRERLERLAFFVMTSQLPSAATMNQLAGATRDVCDMFVARGVSTPSGLTYTAAHCDAVTNAFNRVGLNPALSTTWAEPTLGFSGSQTIHPPGADGRFPMTPGRCPVSNILLRHQVPIVGTTLFADYSPATPMAPSTSVLDWVATTAFDFTGVGTTPAGPLPLGSPVMTHTVRWTSAYGVRPSYATDVQYPATCTPPPSQERSSVTFTRGFDTGEWWGSATVALGNAAPAALPADCTLTDAKLELLDGDGTTRIAGPGANIRHTVTHWILFIPVDFSVNASIVRAPVGRDLSGRVALNWDLGRTARVRWRYTFVVPPGSTASCNPR